MNTDGRKLNLEKEEGEQTWTFFTWAQKVCLADSGIPFPVVYSQQIASKDTSQDGAIRGNGFFSLAASPSPSKLPGASRDQGSTYSAPHGSFI